MSTGAVCKDQSKEKIKKKTKFDQKYDNFSWIFYTLQSILAYFSGMQKLHQYVS